MGRPTTIFLSVAEASGDAHAANLMVALRERIPDVRFVGAAGQRMAAEGCEALADLTDKASMLGGPILRLGYYVRTIKRLQEAIRKIRPDVHVPVDSPAMNWHLAAAAKQAGAPVVYYVSPQVWAWAPWRVKKLARLTDAVACILPFEEEYLRSRGVNATYVGHPIFDDIAPAPETLSDLADAWYTGAWEVALLPGSRPAEIEHHAGLLLAVAEALRKRWPAARCAFATLHGSGEGRIRKIADKAGFPDVEVLVGARSAQELLARSHFALVGSGTVTLQAAHCGVPMVVFYRTGPLMSVLYRTLGRMRSVVATPHFALVNILAGRRIVTELVPWRNNVRRLTDTVMEVIGDLGYLHEMRQSLLEVVRPLRSPHPGGASQCAADLILQTLGHPSDVK